MSTPRHPAQLYKREMGNVWTCAVRDVGVGVNNSTEPATMRVFMMMKA